MPCRGILESEEKKKTSNADPVFILNFDIFHHALIVLILKYYIKIFILVSEFLDIPLSFVACSNGKGVWRRMGEMGYLEHTHCCALVKISCISLTKSPLLCL